MKACILAAGRGQRLDPLTETRPKPIIPVGGKPLLLHTIEMLKGIGISDILLVVGYRKEMIESKFQDGTEYGVNLSYIEQKEFLGTGHAANLAKDFAKGGSLMLIYGDLLMDFEVFKRLIDEHKSSESFGAIATMKVEDPTKYGILAINNESFLQSIEEKPEDDRYGNLANAGVYILPNSIFSAIENTKKSPRGEYELTDSIEINISEGNNYKVVDISDLYWSDVGHPWQLLDANSHFLEKMSNSNYENIKEGSNKESLIINYDAKIENNVTIKGFLMVGKNSTIKSGTYVEGPVIIGENTNIGPNAYLRPYSFIGNNCKVGNSSEIKNSILMDNSAMPHLSYIGDSIVGENVNLGCGTVFANVRLDKNNIKMIIKDNPSETGKRKFGAVVGDNVSFGINVNTMPGIKISSNSYIGSNTIVDEDVERDSIVYVKQSKMKKEKR